MNTPENFFETLNAHGFTPTAEGSNVLVHLACASMAREGVRKMEQAQAMIGILDTVAGLAKGGAPVPPLSLFELSPLKEAYAQSEAAFRKATDTFIDRAVKAFVGLPSPLQNRIEDVCDDLIDVEGESSALFDIVEAFASRVFIENSRALFESSPNAPQAASQPAAASNAEPCAAEPSNTTAKPNDKPDELDVVMSRIVDGLRQQGHNVEVRRLA